MMNITEAKAIVDEAFQKHASRFGVEMGDTGVDMSVYHGFRASTPHDSDLEACVDALLPAIEAYYGTPATILNGSAYTHKLALLGDGPMPGRPKTPVLLDIPFEEGADVSRVPTPRHYMVVVYAKPTI